MRRLLSILIITALAISAVAQSASNCRYTVQVDGNDLSLVSVTMQLFQGPGAFDVAFFRHPEYDDKYWRYVYDLTIISSSGFAEIRRTDSAVWKVRHASYPLSVSYKVKLPQGEAYRAAWKPFLNRNGGLIDGTHLLLFLPGKTDMASELKLILPSGWDAATNLEAVSPKTYRVPNVYTLMDEPILIGKFAQRRITTKQATHSLVYFGDRISTFSLDSLAYYVTRIVAEAGKLFGGLPYKKYLFILQDSAWGALEHRNAITLGAPAEQIKDHPAEVLNELTHEYVHAWNLVRIRPKEFGDIDYKEPALSKDLWFSEGFTLYYADLLARRAGLPALEPTRIDHLKNLLQEYYDSPGNNVLSPELVSQAMNGPQSLLGDYNGSTHLQGELIATVMDLILRHQTNNKRTLDDLMRTMMRTYGNDEGFEGRDVIREMNLLCSCKADSLYDRYIAVGKPLPFKTVLPYMGYMMKLSWKEAKDDQGRPETDKRVYAWHDVKSNQILLGMIDPNSTWGKAGFHTFDTVLRINDQPVTTQRQFFGLVGSGKVNDEMKITLKKGDQTIERTVRLTAYQKPVIKLIPLPKSTLKQKMIQQSWLAGKP